MTRNAAALLALGVIAIVAGVGLMHIPAALVVGGVLTIGAGVLALELPGRKDDVE